VRLLGAPPGLGRRLRPPATQPVLRCATFVCRQEGPASTGVALTFTVALPGERGGRTPHVSPHVVSGPQFSPLTKEIQAAP
jgi:hypothetical protein